MLCCCASWYGHCLQVRGPGKIGVVGGCRPPLLCRPAQGQGYLGTVKAVSDVFGGAEHAVTSLLVLVLPDKTQANFNGL